MVEEANGISRATGEAPLQYTSMLLAAWRGEEVSALNLIESDVKDASARGEGRAVGLAAYATALLYNGLGRYDAACEAARRACEYEDLGFYGWSLIELIEAAARMGERDLASTALLALRVQTDAVRTAGRWEAKLDPEHCWRKAPPPNRLTSKRWSGSGGPRYEPISPAVI